MSGTNPFRRKPPLQQSPLESASEHEYRPDWRQTEAQVPPIDTDIPRATKSKTVKSVRIISPHSAQSEAENYITDSFDHAPKSALFSPPPEPVFLAGQDGGIDPFQAEFETLSPGSEDDATLQNTRSNAGVEEFQVQPSSNIGKPSNPFKKPVLALEQVRPSAAAATTEGSTSRTGVPANKPHYDVDDFKKLLLAGERQSSASFAARAPNVNFGAPSVGDNSSATDSSSLSRQSLFEPTAGTLSESPRTSRDASPAEEERHRLASHTVQHERIKPSPPHHRHGKLVKVIAPQTVSSEDPALSFAVSDTKPKDAAELAPSVVSAQKVKPLPPLPPVPRAKDGRKTSEGSILTNSSEDVESNNLSTKRTLPLAPASRKSGQNRPISLSSLHGRSPPTPDRKLSDSPPMSASPPFDPVNAPPPPPPRRSATVRVNSSSSTLTLASTASGSEQSRPLFQLPRSPTMPITKPTESSSPLSGSPAKVVPPLPPPRRRRSSQSSYTPSRFSSDYRGAVTERLRSDSGASSISHLAMTPIEPSQSKPDVLADLTALQREVDELRGKIKE